MKLRRIQFVVSHVVDIDNKKMVQKAEDDILNLVRGVVLSDDIKELRAHISQVVDFDAKESDIPEFLKEA